MIVGYTPAWLVACYPGWLHELWYSAHTMTSLASPPPRPPGRLVGGLAEGGDAWRKQGSGRGAGGGLGGDQPGLVMIDEGSMVQGRVFE